MENYSKWDDEEVKTLFRFVEIKKQEGIPLIKIFADYAEKTSRQANSVRNYYYKELGNLQQDVSRAIEFGIDLKNHIVTQSRPFSPQEENDVINQINELKEKGYSVRRACLELSGGDISAMIRLQNKYRSITKPQQKTRQSDSNMGQIIKMQPKQPKISDEEIKALFFGLIRIVKKQEQDNIKAQYESEIFDANEKLKNAFLEMAQKQSIIENLQQKLKLIKDELLNQKTLQQKNNMSRQNGKTASMILKKYFSNQKSYSTNQTVVKK